MRTILFIAFIASVTGLKAQTFQEGSFFNNGYAGQPVNSFHFDDSSSTKKWSFSKYSAISGYYSFFKGGNATVVAAPIGMQLTRRLNNNLYAFGNVSLAPAYVNFNRGFITNDFKTLNQNNTFLKAGSVGAYSRAALGLQYINDEKTFSISGSIGVERSSHPVLQASPVNHSRISNVKY